MLKRVLTTIVLWGGVFAVLRVFGSTGAVAVITLSSMLTLREFYRLSSAGGAKPFLNLGMLFGGLITIAPWLEARFGGAHHHFAAHSLLPLATVVFSVRILGERKPENRVTALGATLFGLVYISLLFQYLVRIATPLPGDTVTSVGRMILCLWVVAVCKFCDTGALLAGMAAGRTPLAPNISPKKTWEGAVGGVLLGMLVGAFGAWLGRDWLPPSFGPLRAALIAGPVAVAAIISDLVESILKRQVNIKDSGDGIPGIGGVFDLTDSILLAAPVAYFLLGFR
jgi:phosphatidate cytidylyltransferase